MTKETIEKFLKQYDGRKDVRSFIKPSHIEELSPLFECHLEAVDVRKDEFHELEGGKSYMPRKETMDKFAQAAGISYNEAAEKTWKEGDTCYVGRSQAMVMGPDGKWILGDVCEYEFDADIRTEEARLNGAADWDHMIGKRPGKREYTEKELAVQRIQFLKVGRQRANTGARNRATVAILGMSTGFKGLFEKNEPDTAKRTFLFSRIIVNAKNEMVMNAMLQSMGSNVQSLFGPSAPSKAIAAPVATGNDAPDTRPAADASTSFDDDLGEFDSTPAQVTTGIDPLLVALEEWQHSSRVPDALRSAIQGLMDRGEAREEFLRSALALVKLMDRVPVESAKIPGAIAAMLSDPAATKESLEKLRSDIDAALLKKGH